MKIEELISAVYVRNSLWDQNDDCHRNRFVLDKLWDEIAAQMGSTREAVRSKWKTLRDTYRKELQKRARVNENETERSTLSRSSNWTHLRSWKYFNNLSFLCNQFEVGRNGNFEIIDTTSNSQTLKRKRSESPTIPAIVQDECRKEPDLYRTGDGHFDSTPQNFRGIFVPLQQQQQHQYPREDEADAANTPMKTDQIKNTSKNDDANDDEDMHFFKSLLPHVKQLSPQQKMLLRMKLHGVVYDFVYTQSNTSEINTIGTEYSNKYLAD